LFLEVMSHYDQQQAPLAYPSPVTAYPAQRTYVAPPPPIGYPTKVDSGYPQYTAPIETTTRGDGFWKGCVAALCCCWICESCCF
ncbi:hypothetical protein SO802_010465, partial [Lithocarpus litseifolius]